MPTHDDANLVLRLYELRREDRMRKARSWFLSSCKARSMEDLDKVCPLGSEEHASLRMVASYWEMVASFLNSGVLDKELFYKTGTEMLVAYLRLSDVLPEMRKAYQDPTLSGELEQAALEMMDWKKSRAPEGFEVFKKRVRGE